LVVGSAVADTSTDDPAQPMHTTVTIYVQRMMKRDAVTRREIKENGKATTAAVAAEANA